MHDRRCGAGRLHRGRETRHRGGNPGDDRSQETRADHEGAGNAHLQRRRRVHLLGFEGSVGRDLRMDDRRAGEVENLDHRRSGNQRHHRQGGQRRRGDSRPVGVGGGQKRTGREQGARVFRGDHRVGPHRAAGLYDQEVRQTLVDDRELPRSGRGRQSGRCARPDGFLGCGVGGVAFAAVERRKGPLLHLV